MNDLFGLGIKKVTSKGLRATTSPLHDILNVYLEPILRLQGHIQVMSCHFMSVLILKDGDQERCVTSHMDPRRWASQHLDSTRHSAP